jgi:hypothetical protein
MGLWSSGYPPQFFLVVGARGTPSTSRAMVTSSRAPSVSCSVLGLMRRERLRGAPQVADLDVFQRTHCVLDLGRQMAEITTRRWL